MSSRLLRVWFVVVLFVILFIYFYVYLHSCHELFTLYDQSQMYRFLLICFSFYLFIPGVMYIHSTFYITIFALQSITLFMIIVLYKNQKCCFISFTIDHSFNFIFHPRNKVWTEENYLLIIKSRYFSHAHYNTHVNIVII